MTTELNSVVVVTLAVKTGVHAAHGIERRTIHFDAFPTTQDIVEQLSDDPKFTELLKLCEADEVSEYISDFDDEQFVSFECHDQDGQHMGSIIIEGYPIIAASTVSI